MKKWIDTRTRTRNREGCDSPKNMERGIWSVVLVEDDEILEFGSLNWPSVCSGPWPFRTDGEESCIQRTWKMAKLVSSPHQVMTVMKQAHWGYAWKLLIQETLGRMVWQPENRGNALGVFLPVSYIRSHDPDGIVILWSVGQTGVVHDPVLDRLRSAIARVNQVPDILVGVECFRTSDDGKEGWEWHEGTHATKRASCVAGQNSGHRVTPTCPKADGIDEHPAVGVLVARVDTLWQAGKTLLPNLLNRLDALGPVLGTSREQQILSDLYQATPVETLEANVFPFLSSQLEIMPLPNKSQHQMGAHHSGERVES